MSSHKSSGRHTKQAHVDIPEGLYEEEHGRKGFYGRVSHIYHENPPVGWTNIEGDLKPRLLASSFVAKEELTPLLYNNDLVLSTGVFSKSWDCFFRNADFDELYFIHQGEGVFETIYGPLVYKKGDYILLPRGTTYTLIPQNKTQVLRIEGASEFEEPSRGLLGPNALYDQTAVATPEVQKGSQNQKEYRVKIKRLGKITTVTYPFNPLDAQGWKGSLYPKKLSIYDFCPVMSHRYHIPPSAHTTFINKNFVVCSFVARPLEDSQHGVLKVPFYHSNIDYDEVLFYHEGSFFSRDNIQPSSLSFHPQGIHHGPHPKAFEKANEKKFTDEYAVMLDARHPLHRTKAFESLEEKDYWKSWLK